MPRFSVIIPAHNRAALIGATLESVFAQRFGDFEVIVIDDGSTDGTVAAARSHGGRVRVIEQQNKGPGAARNAGIAAATGHYVAFLDSDDLWFPWTLATYDQVLREHGEPAFISGEPIYFTREVELAGVAQAPLRCRLYDNYIATSTDQVWVGTCAVAIRTESLRRVGGFVDRWVNAEDSDLWLRLGAEPGFVHIEAPAVFGYRRHEGTAIASLDRTLAGVRHLVSQEKASAYPGGVAGAADRRRIITAHARPVAVALAKAGWAGDALALYSSTLSWNLALGRLRYVLALPIVAALGAVRRGRP